MKKVRIMLNGRGMELALNTVVVVAILLIVAVVIISFFLSATSTAFNPIRDLLGIGAQNLNNSIQKLG